MTEKNWVVLDDIPGMMDVEILKGLLEAQGIPVVLSQEGAGKSLGLYVGPLGEVQILVPESKFESAREILKDFYDGDTKSDAEENVDEE
jgi:hypothetical protein